MVRSPMQRLPWVVVATSFGFVVVQLDVTIVNVALPRISLDLDAAITWLQWVVDAYTLTFAALLLSSGVLGDRFGARRSYVLGFGIFGAASLACGLAPTVEALVAARALQGLGAAILLPNSLSLLNQASAHDGRVRARGVALWTAAGGVSIAAGPVVGGLLLEAVGWRSIFLVNVPLCVLAVWLTFRVVPRADTPGHARSLDVPGQVLAIVALSALTGAVIEIRALGAMHPAIWVAGGVAIAAGLSFVAVERRTVHPMLPLELLQRPSLGPAVLFGVLVNLTYYGAIFVLSLYFQQVLHYSALRAGLAFLPLTATFIVSNVVSGWLTARVGVRRPMAIGGLIGACGFALLATLGSGSTLVQMLPAFVLIPGGMGLGVPAMTTSVLSAVEPSRAGTASALLNAARQAGGAMGVAFFGGMAGNGVAHVVGALRWSGVLSAALLIGAAVLAWTGIHGGPVDARGLEAPRRT